jgi:amino acid transporter
MEEIVTRIEIGENVERRAYKQELHRSLGLWENISLVVSAVTPATGAFIIAPVLFTLTGTGAPLTFVIAAAMGLALAFCWAELGCAYPIAGGDYTFVARILGRPAGFVSLILSGPVQAVLIPAVVALGIGQYVGVIFNVNTNILAAVIILLGAAVAIWGVRLSAIAVGVLLAIELLAVVFVGALGLFHVQRPISTLFQPLITNPDGTTQTLTIGALVAGIAVASFAYNGFQGALLYSEETTGSRRNVARSVFIALGVAVACEVLPVAMAILASPSLADLSASPNAWQYFLTSIGGDTFNTIISLGIAIAVLNAVVALMPFFARILYSSGRDMAWPAPMSKALASVHPRWGTPWVSTIVVGVAGAVLVLFTDVATLSTCVGAVLCVEFILVAASAIVSRLKDKTTDRPYRMPLWPAAPIVAIVMSVVVLTQQTSSDLLVAGGIVVISLAYYLVYLRPRRRTHMLMLDPVRPIEALTQRRHRPNADVDD